MGHPRTITQHLLPDLKHCGVQPFTTSHSHFEGLIIWGCHSPTIETIKAYSKLKNSTFHYDHSHCIENGLFVSLSESFKMLCNDYNTWWLQFIHKCRFCFRKMLKLYAVMITKSTFMYNMPHQKTRRKCLHASRYGGHDVCYRNFELIWMKHFWEQNIDRMT